MTTTRPIADIETALSEARRQVQATSEAHEGAQDVFDALSAELFLARKAADASLPTARVMRSGRFTDTVVIARRTKSTIYTRHIGSAPDTECAWRKSKYTPGQWNEHPKRHWFAPETLQLDEQK